jgi:hypothetical protein
VESNYQSCYVYVGFQVLLDLTGIFMCGQASAAVYSSYADVGFHRHCKIPTLKISLIQIFMA